MQYKDINYYITKYCKHQLPAAPGQNCAVKINKFHSILSTRAPVENSSTERNSAGNM